MTGAVAYTSSTDHSSDVAAAKADFAADDAASASTTVASADVASTTAAAAVDDQIVSTTTASASASDSAGDWFGKAEDATTTTVAALPKSDDAQAVQTGQDAISAWETSVQDKPSETPKVASVVPDSATASSSAGDGGDLVAEFANKFHAATDDEKKEASDKAAAADADKKAADGFSTNDVDKWAKLLRENLIQKNGHAISQHQHLAGHKAQPRLFSIKLFKTTRQ